MKLLSRAPSRAGPRPRPLGLALAAALVLLPARAAQEPQQASRAELTAAIAAKVLASGVFVSGRDPDDVLEKNVHRMIGLFGYQPTDIADVHVDRRAGVVTLQLEDAPPRSAKFCGDQGCVVLPRGETGVHFEPLAVRSEARDRSSEPWPTGDQIDEDSPLPEGVDAEKLAAAVDAAFAPQADTAGLLVVLGGQIVAERYGSGAERDTPLECWSMGKSLTAILYGRALYLAGEEFDPFVPAPIPEWYAQPGDPRAEIQVAHLLRMSSGLRFSHLAADPPEAWDHAHPDHFYVYSGAIDVFEFSRTRPLEHPPGTVGRYRNCDPLLIGYLVRRMVEARGESYLAFPQRALFDVLGMRHTTLEPDPYGNFISTGYEYGTVRDWARLGLLVLQDGVWEGERLLPEGFTEFVSAPAPAWERGEYGGLFWVNGNRRWNLPQSAYLMAGHGTQHVFVVPTHDLVVARMGHQRGGRQGFVALNEALRILMEAIPPLWRPLLTPGGFEDWHIAPGGSWKWRGDVLVGRSERSEQRHGLLISDARYGDFEARLEFRTLSGCSGFYFRVDETGGGTGVSGFQAEVDPSFETGGLYETGGRAWVVKPDPQEMRAIYHPGEWTEMTVSAVGGDVEVRVNGHVTATLTGDAGRREGHFALQLHGGQDLHVEFRNLKVRPLGR